MANPILRAGPFASASDSFLDEPETPVATIVPVNCATNDWVNDSWKLHLESTGIYDMPFREDGYYDGLPSGDSFLDQTVGGAEGFVRYAFRYQAAVDATLNIDASASATSLGGGVCDIEVTVGGELIIDETNPVLVEIDEDINLPASVVPKLVFIDVRAEAFSAGTNSTTVQGSLSISVPT